LYRARWDAFHNHHRRRKPQPASGRVRGRREDADGRAVGLPQQVVGIAGQVTLKLHLIDAFADGPFTGNPAAVTLLDSPRPDAWMQQVAMEMNQAETAFLLRQEDGFSLRWFT